MDEGIFDAALSHSRRGDASEKREENSASTFGRFRLWTSFESSPVSVKESKKIIFLLHFNMLPFTKNRKQMIQRLNIQYVMNIIEFFKLSYFL